MLVTLAQAAVLLTPLWVGLWALNYALTHGPRDRVAAVPEGWKIKRRGTLGRRGWDAYDPKEGRWLGWRYPWKENAADHAWQVTSFEHALEQLEERRNDRK